LSVATDNLSVLLKIKNESGHICNRTLLPTAGFINTTQLHGDFQ